MIPQTDGLDDQGTQPGEAAQMLQKLAAAFDHDNEKLAVILGRTTDEITHALSGNAEAFDDDLVMKMRGIAKERGFDI